MDHDRKYRFSSGNDAGHSEPRSEVKPAVEYPDSFEIFLGSDEIDELTMASLREDTTRGSIIESIVGEWAQQQKDAAKNKYRCTECGNTDTDSIRADAMVNQKFTLKLNGGKHELVDEGYDSEIISNTINLYCDVCDNEWTQGIL